MPDSAFPEARASPHPGGTAASDVSGERGKLQSIRVDNGPEFISMSVDLWAYFNGVKVDFSGPGKPTDTCSIREPIGGQVNPIWGP